MAVLESHCLDTLIHILVLVNTLVVNLRTLVLNRRILVVNRRTLVVNLEQMNLFLLEHVLVIDLIMK